MCPSIAEHSYPKTICVLRRLLGLQASDFFDDTDSVHHLADTLAARAFHSFPGLPYDLAVDVIRKDSGSLHQHFQKLPEHLRPLAVGAHIPPLRSAVRNTLNCSESDPADQPSFDVRVSSLSPNELLPPDAETDTAAISGAPLWVHVANRDSLKSQRYVVGTRDLVRPDFALLTFRDAVACHMHAVCSTIRSEHFSLPQGSYLVLCRKECPVTFSDVTFEGAGFLAL